MLGGQVFGWLLLWMICAGPGQMALAQSQQPAPPVPTNPRSGRIPIGSEDENSNDPAMRHAEEQAAERRNVDRQKQLVADTNKLLQLAQELKTEVDRSNKETLSVAVVKKAEEIEKLAKSVKDKMKAQ